MHKVAQTTLCAFVKRTRSVWIYEATKNIGSETKNSHPEIPWKYMAGMRDRLVHAYFGVDYSILWQVASEELPKIMKKLEPLLR